MTENTRREFLSEVGRGMLIASLGPSLCADLCLAQEPIAGGSDELTFGELEPLVALMQETAPDELLAVLVQKLATGTELRILVAAGALANARTFGGEDYTGYHAFMAMMPAYQMAQGLPKAERALPVLKVLYRSTARIQERGGRAREVLREVEPRALPDGVDADRALREAVFSRDIDGAERTFARIAERPAPEAYAVLRRVVHVDVDVHRLVLAWRA